ncbi:hypothetical protein CRM22_001490 [Opisthorchis felineus]|uniref:MARVEL domain-containing protein n=1 Tax=Opisthorchis felineus TaxID=147828 RepID=A0A4S2MGD1_OPIFE|nr:hypothetical protein CRM22_001490 [Opisthorchis felineus]
MPQVTKILVIVAAGIGILCTLASIATIGDNLGQLPTSALKAGAAFNFLALFVFIAAVVVVAIGFCISMEEKLTGIIATALGGAAVLLAIIAYGCYYKILVEQGGKPPSVYEWIFGGMIAGTGLILTAVNLIFSS